MTLSERDRAILDFERTWWQGDGAKSDAIKDRFGISGTRYYELLRELSDDPDAMEYDPLLVRRLRRGQARRRRARFEHRSADGPGR